jgi:hypothetical protein
MSTLSINTISGQTAANSVVVTGEGGTTTTSLQQGLAKSWCYFNTVTTTVINESFNVASLTDTGTGDTDVNLTNAFSSASIVANYNVGNGANGDQSFIQTTTTTSSIHCFNYSGANAAFDSAYCALTAHGDLA